MIDIATILLFLTLLFGFFLFLRAYTSFRICALCAATALTWMTLLVIDVAFISVDPVIIGILMGGSVVGLMYFLEEKFHPRYQIFKLPYLITTLSIVYVLLGGEITSILLILLIGLWVIFSLLYLMRNSEGLRKSIQHIIECCKNW